MAAGPDNLHDPGRESLVYQPARVSWALAELVARPPALLSRLSLYLVAGVIASAGAYAYWSEVSITVAGQGSIRTNEKPLPVKALVGGKLGSFLVTEGQFIKQGEVVAAMQEQLTAPDVRSSMQFMAIVRETLRGGSNARGYQAAKRAATTPLSLSANQLPQLVSGIVDASKAYEQALSNLLFATPLATRGQEEQLRVVQGKIERIRKNRLEARLAQEYEELQSSQAQMKSGLDEKREGARQRVNQSKIALESALNNLSNAIARHNVDQKITAPMSGVVSGVNVAGAGEVVSSGQELFQIIPEGAELIAEMRLANKDIAEVKPGQKVRVKLDAYPSQDFGWIDGTVRELPPDVEKSRDQKPEAALYRVIVGLRREYIEYQGQRKPAKLGMTLTGEIELKRKTLMKLALSEVFKLKEAIK